MTYYRTIHLADTDAAGVVYFAAVLSMCHEAYEASLQEYGVNLREFFTNREIGIPIVQAQVNFFRPLFCGDRLAIELMAKQLKESEFEIEYKLESCTPREYVAQGKTRHVCISLQTRERTAIPETMLKWLTTLGNRKTG